jgi:hypothetical protein
MGYDAHITSLPRGELVNGTTLVPLQLGPAGPS